MSNKKEAIVAIQEFDDAVKGILLAKEKLTGLIMSMPENHTIERLSSTAFIIQKSDLNKGLELSPSFYDFKIQYIAISEAVLKSDDVRATLEEIVKVKSVAKHHSAGWGTIRLHPAVVNNLKTLIGQE